MITHMSYKETLNVSYSYILTENEIMFSAVLMS